jgi:DNA-binding CsgD family transcriptional regulator/tetratricopeptide (TPR) repeat protein
VPARVTSSRFVGRQTELAELEHLLAETAGGRAQMAFVTAESGMGKTRLVDELAERARADGTRVLFGECIELGAGELPYAPIVGALRPLARNQDPVLDAIGSARAELAQLLPELGEARRRSNDLGAATPQARLFEALLALLERLGRDAPVLLVVEDLHWADRSTRDFLIFLSRALCRERVLVVGTYRSDELHRRHPLRPVLAELERGERARRIALRPFTRGELVDQLTDILGGEPDRVLVDRLLARSEGNPLFAEELLAAGRDGRGELPPTLRDALILRVESLPDAGQELLRVVAAGQRVDHEVLREVSGVEGRPLREALRETVAHGLLVPDEDGRYAFRHALLREAVLDDLLPGERTELHLALAEALHRRIAEGSGASTLDAAAEVAYHFDEAGDRPRAFVAALRAADDAERVHANGEAAALLERALELWSRAPEEATKLAGCDHVDLLCRAARNHELSSEFMRMRTLLREALDELDEEADARRAAAVLERLGHALWALGKGDEALQSYERALALLSDDEPSSERAKVLAARGRAMMLAGHFADGVERCQEAIAAARAAGDAGIEEHALNTLGVCRAALGDVDGGESALRESIAMARRRDDPDGIHRGFSNLADSLFLAGRTVEARDVAREGLEELRETGQCRWLTIMLAEIHFALGDWDEAEALVSAEAVSRSTGGARVNILLRRGELLLGRGDVDEALAVLEEAHDRTARSLEPQWHGPIAALLAEAYRRRRRFDDARTAIGCGLDRLTGDLARLARVAASAAAVEADAAQQARDLGRPDEAEVAAQRAADMVELAEEGASSPDARRRPRVPVYRALTDAEAARARGEADPAAWADLAARWEELADPYEAARARWREAEAHAGAGDRAAAQETAARAYEVAERLGARWLVDELDVLARRARLRLGHAEEPATEDAPPAPGDELGLTAREREVLSLLAEGRTNREIGEALFMAEKTASVHVSRILAKLDVRSRTEAAAVAHRLGLAAM